MKVDRDQHAQDRRSDDVLLSVGLSVCLSSSLLQLLFVLLQLRHEAGVRIDHMTSRLHFLGTETSVQLLNVSLDVMKHVTYWRKKN